MRENHGVTEFTEFLSGLSPWPSCLGGENLQSAGASNEFKQNWRLKSATGGEIRESHFNFSEWTVIVYRIVEFSSEGAILRGRLYAPTNLSKPLPIVIMAHGFSATINGMVADHFAEPFYDSGFAVLLYDHRNFGISDGEPRQEINKWIQARGLS